MGHTPSDRIVRLDRRYEVTWNQASALIDQLIERILTDRARLTPYLIVKLNSF